MEEVKKKKKKKDMEGPPARTRARRRFEHLVSTRPVLSECARCFQPILIGHADGQPAHVEIYPADRHVEIVALLTGRQAYTVIAGCLARRFGTDTSRPIFVEHRCGLTLTTAPPVTPRTVMQDRIPF